MTPAAAQSAYDEAIRARFIATDGQMKSRRSPRTAKHLTDCLHAWLEAEIEAEAQAPEQAELPLERKAA